MNRIILLLVFSLGFGLTAKAEKMYVKEYYPTGVLKAEGWQMDTMKMDYWILYHPNGNIASKGHFRNNTQNGYWYFFNSNGKLEKEGHFVNGSAENWWIFYEIGTRNKTKFEYTNNARNGYALHYKKRRLVLVEKYVEGRRTGSWTSYSDFKRDNPKVSF